MLLVWFTLKFEVCSKYNKKRLHVFTNDSVLLHPLLGQEVRPSSMFLILWLLIFRLTITTTITMITTTTTMTTIMLIVSKMFLVINLIENNSKFYCNWNLLPVSMNMNMKMASGGGGLGRKLRRRRTPITYSNDVHEDKFSLLNLYTSIAKKKLNQGSLCT